MSEKVWVQSSTLGWVPGELLGKGDKPSSVKIRDNEGVERIVLESETLPMHEDLEKVDDLTTLEELNEPVILYNLYHRYMSQEIYTYIGPMLISVNPFCVLKQYGEHLIPEYKNKPKENLKPHPYYIAQNAFSSLVTLSNSQSVIISGESGAGKTEATKIILKYLTVVSEGSNSDVAKSILATNPILESMGNAKTIRNNNSSRFGKLIKVNFNTVGKITGANINNYLLENTRIVGQAPNERNYHVFYQLIKGTSPQEKKNYKLYDSPKQYRYLSNGDIEAPGLDDVREFDNLKKAFKLLKFHDGEIEELFTIMSAILMLGNVDFDGTDSVTIKNKEELGRFCDILGISIQKMEEALTLRFMRGGGRSTTYSIPLNYSQAIENRDAISKAIYSKIFDYVIMRINGNLTTPASKADDLFIAVLDIYGFEIFDKNSLEQLLINYANEKLQEQFIQHMFKFEQEEYLKEGVKWSQVDFEDNAGCIDMLERARTGLLSLLDEEGQLPKGSEKSLLQKLDQTYKKHQFFTYLLRKPTEFTIRHFAGVVNYSVDNFIEKNKNTLGAGVGICLSLSKNRILKDLFTEKSEESPAKSALSRQPTRQNASPSANKATVSQLFKRDLQELCKILSSSERHYIRCIKPNELKQSGTFDHLKVLAQMKSNGVMETVALRKAGFSNKMTSQTFYNRYSTLGVSGGDKNRIKAFLENYLDASLWAVGNTKIFLRVAAINKLEDARKNRLEKSVVVLQTYIRGFRAVLYLILLKKLKKEEEERKRKEEEERRRKEEEERKRREEERRRLEEEKKRQEEERRRLEEDKRRQEDLRRKKDEDDKQRMEDDRRRRIEEEKRQKLDEEKRKSQLELDKQREDEKRRRQEEDNRRQEQEKRKSEPKSPGSKIPSAQRPILEQKLKRLWEEINKKIQIDEQSRRQQERENQWVEFANVLKLEDDKRRKIYTDIELKRVEKEEKEKSVNMERYRKPNENGRLPQSPQTTQTSQTQQTPQTPRPAWTRVNTRKEFETSPSSSPATPIITRTPAPVQRQLTFTEHRKPPQQSSLQRQTAPLKFVENSKPYGTYSSESLDPGQLKRRRSRSIGGEVEHKPKVPSRSTKPRGNESPKPVQSNELVRRRSRSINNNEPTRGTRMAMAYAAKKYPSGQQRQ